MTKLVIKLVAALIAALIGMPTAVTALPATPTAGSYIYDSQLHLAQPVTTASERGPPKTSYDLKTGAYAVDRWSHGASPRPEEFASGSTAAYTTPAGFVRVARATGATEAGVQGDARALSALTRSDVAANKGPTTLFHYTDEAGQRGILESGRLNPSLKSVSPKDARYGDGQYLTDVAPGTKTCAQLSACFLGIPFQGRKFTHYVEIDVSGLNIVKGRDGVFVNRSGDPLDITRRLISGGIN